MGGPQVGRDGRDATLQGQGRPSQVVREGVPQQIARSDQGPEQPEQEDTQHSGRSAHRSALAEATAKQSRSRDEADGDDECQETHPGRRHPREQKKAADTGAEGKPETNQHEARPVSWDRLRQSSQGPGLSAARVHHPAPRGAALSRDGVRVGGGGGR